VEVARAGLAADPPIDAPRALRPLLRFRRLSTSALESVRRVLDDDPSFRARVAEAGADGADRLGPAGRLYLARPEGWVDELRRLEEAAALDAEAVAADAEERSARKRLRLVEEAAARAEATVEALRADVVVLRNDLVAERQARQQAEERGAAAERRIHGLERERDAAHRRAAAAEAEVTRLRREQPPAAAADAARTAAPADASTMGAPSSSTGDAAVSTGADGAEAGVEASVAAAPLDAVAAAPVAPAIAVDDLRSAIADAGAAAAALGASLADAARALGHAEASGGAGDVPSARRDAGGRRPRARRQAGRLPVALPPGLFDDDPAAAEHLVRVRGSVVVVDGYNASLRRWPELPIAEQRRRLVDALAGLAARCGAEVQVVFDGADDVARGTTLARRGVQVRFSPREVEADDVILDQVDRLPVTRPVVVASDDRRVRREAAARGANVIGQAQLFSLL